MGKKLRRSEAIWLEKENRWQVKVQKDGVRKTFHSSTPGRKGKHECEEKADNWLESGSETDVRFGAAWAEYLENVKATTKDESYIKAESIGRNWLASLDKKKLSAIVPADFQKCINAAGQAGRAKRTCGNIRAQAFAFHKYCLTRRWPLQDPRPLTLPTDAPVGKRTILQPNAVKTLFTDDTALWRGQVKSDFYIHAYRFLFLVVLRRGELCGIKVEDIKDGVLDLQRAFNRLNQETQGKNKNALRQILLPPMARQVVEEQKAMLKRKGIISPWLFPDDRGNRLDTNKFFKAWKRYRTLHDMASTLHEIRHSSISSLKADLPLSLMKPAIGHSLSMDTLGTYGHEVDGDMQMTANIMEQVYRRLVADPAPGGPSSEAK